MSHREEECVVPPEAGAAEGDGLEKGRWAGRLEFRESIE